MLFFLIWTTQGYKHAFYLKYIIESNSWSEKEYIHIRNTINPLDPSGPKSLKHSYNFRH